MNLLGSFFSSTIPVLAENTLRFVGAIFLISRYDLKLTLVALPALPLFFEVSRRSVGMIRTTSLGTIETSAKVRGKIQDTLSGIEVVKTFGKEGQETAAIKGDLRSMIEVETLQNLFSSISGRVLAVITGLNLLLILWFGGHEIIAGRLSVGQYMAFVAYLGYLYSPIQLFAITFIQLQRTMMACKRISSFLDRSAEDENPARTHDPMTLRGAICFDKVHYSFGNGKDVLRDVSFDIRGGEKVAFVGKSGAGKSTLVHLALGLYEPTSGRIEIDGFDLKTIKLDSLRKRIGIVSQNVLLFDDSLLNNIKYSRPEASLAEVIAAAKASGCHDFISRFPEGYNTRAGEIGKRLSGGEKQRISVARCLLKMPDVVIFDEPTAHLDPLAAKDVIDSIQELFKDRTCIIISHNLNNIHWADRVYVLEDGCLVQEGRHEDLVRIAGCYRELTDASMAVSARLVS